MKTLSRTWHSMGSMRYLLICVCPLLLIFAMLVPASAFAIADTPEQGDENTPKTTSVIGTDKEAGTSEFASDESEPTDTLANPEAIQTGDSASDSDSNSAASDDGLEQTGLKPGETANETAGQAEGDSSDGTGPELKEPAATGSDAAADADTAKPAEDTTAKTEQATAPTAKTEPAASKSDATASISVPAPTPKASAASSTSPTASKAASSSSSSSTMKAQATTTPPRVVSVNGKYYYQVNGKTQKAKNDRIVKVGESYYYVLTNGEVLTQPQAIVTDVIGNGLLKAGRYSFRNNGTLVKVSGIYKRTASDWYFQNKNWILVENKLVKYDSKYYSTNWKGQIRKNCNYNLPESETAFGIKPGYYHITADGTFIASNKATELREALTNRMWISASGKDNKVNLKVTYNGVDSKLTNMLVSLKTARLKSSIATRDVKLTSRSKGEFCLSFDKLAPNTAYYFDISPYYSVKTANCSYTTFTDYGSCKRTVKTTAKNTYKAYTNAAAQSRVLSDLINRKSTGTFMLNVTAAQASNIDKKKIYISDLFTDKLTADTSSRLGSLIDECLRFTVNQGDTYKSGSKYYVIVNVASKSTAQQVKNYKSMVSWYNKAKSAANGKNAKNTVKTLAKYLMDRCSYDYSFKSSSYEDTGAVLKGKAVCSGYAETFKKMCIYAGVACEYVASSCHAWNLVKLGGKWYHYDVTWNDCVSSQRAYSFMGSKQAAKDPERKNWQPRKGTRKSYAIPISSLAW